MTSAVAARLIALRKLLSSLATWPLPLAPMWWTVAAKCASTGRTGVERLGLAAGHDRQRARLGAGGAAGDARVDVGDAARGQALVERDGRVRRRRAEVDDDLPGAQVRPELARRPPRSRGCRAARAARRRRRRASAASDAAGRRARGGRACGVEVEADHLLAAVHQPARDPPAHVPQADDADRHAPSSSMRIGTPTAHEWIPMTLTSSITSMISSRVAPQPERVADVRAQAGLVEVRRRDVEGDVDHLLDLGLEHAVRPRDPGEQRVGRQELGVEREDVVPERVPVAALGLEVGLDLAAAVVERALDRLAGGLELLHEDRHADVARVDAQGARQLEHLHELLAGGPVPDRVAHVLADAGLEQVGGGGVHRQQHELLDLGLQRSVAPRHRRELQVGREEVGIELEQALPQRRPEAARLDERLAQLAAAVVGHRISTAKSAAGPSTRG